MKGKSARWRSGRGRRKSCFQIGVRRSKDVRGRCAVETRCDFQNVSRTVMVGAECGMGHRVILVIVAITENARFEFEVRPHVSDQAPRQRVVLSSHFYRAEQLDLLFHKDWLRIYRIDQRVEGSTNTSNLCHRRHSERFAIRSSIPKIWRKSGDSPVGSTFGHVIPLFSQ